MVVSVCSRTRVRHDEVVRTERAPRKSAIIMFTIEKAADFRRLAVGTNVGE